MPNSDIKIALSMGVVASFFLSPTVYVSGLPLWLIPTSLLSVPSIFSLGIVLGRLLNRVIGFGERFSRYACAGLLSFSIDFGILNIVSALSGVTAGLTIGWINMPGFLVGVVNAYIWNRLWVFPKPPAEALFSRFSQFFFVGIVGVILNSAIIVILTTHVAQPATFTDHQWLNVTKIIASGAVIFWSFFGYKFIAFRNHRIS